MRIVNRIMALVLLGAMTAACVPKKDSTPPPRPELVTNHDRCEEPYVRAIFKFHRFDDDRQPVSGGVIVTVLLADGAPVMIKKKGTEQKVPFSIIVPFNNEGRWSLCIEHGMAATAVAVKFEAYTVALDARRVEYVVSECFDHRERLLSADVNYWETAGRTIRNLSMTCVIFR